MTRRRSALAPALVATALALLPWPALGQYDDDEQTEDHAQRDRRYLERYEAQPLPEAAPAAIDPREQARYFAFVDDLIRDRNYGAHTSEHYRVQTDDPRVDAAAVAALLESFRGFFETYWDGRIDLQPYDEPSRVYLFWSYHKYNKLLGADFSRSLLRPKGHYGSAFDALTLHTDSEAAGDLPDTVVHEAAHQLVDRRIAWRRGSPPTWLGEGLACYFGYMAIDQDGVFHEDRVGTKRLTLFKDGKPEKPTAPAGRLQVFKRGMKDAADDSVYGRLLWATDPAQFYGGDTQFHYAAAWMLVHFLLEGDDGRHADAFVDWIAREAAGEAGPQELVDGIGLGLEGLDAAVRDHARGVKVR